MALSEVKAVGKHHLAFGRPKALLFHQRGSFHRDFVLKHFVLIKRTRVGAQPDWLIKF